MNTSGTINKIFEEKQREIYNSIEDYLFDIECLEVTAQQLDIIT